MATLTVVDETLTGEKRTWDLDVSDLLAEVIPLRELIRRRVYQEVAEENLQRAATTEGKVLEAGYLPLGSRRRGSGRLDWEAEYEKAIEAFTRRGYIVLVDDAQVTDLDAPVHLCAGSEITFLRMVPLIGG